MILRLTGALIKSIVARDAAEDALTRIRVDGLDAVLRKLPPSLDVNLDELISSAILQSTGQVKIIAIHAGFFLGTPALVKKFLAASPKNSVRAIIFDPMQENVVRRSRRIVGEFAHEYLGSFYDIADNIIPLERKVKIKVLRDAPEFRLFLLPSVALVQYYEPYKHGRESDLIVVPKRGPLHDEKVLEIILSKINGGEVAINSLYEYFEHIFEERWNCDKVSDLKKIEGETQDRLRSVYAHLFGLRPRKSKPHVNLVSDIRSKLFDNTHKPFTGNWETDTAHFTKALGAYCDKVGAVISWNGDSEAKINGQSPPFQIDVKVVFTKPHFRARFCAIGQKSWRTLKLLRIDLDSQLGP